jgi:hypothetical protein
METGTRAARLRELGLTYDEYLESELWLKLRERYRNSPLPQRCLSCRTDRWLQLHHRTYQRLGREWLTDLIPLCGVCHQCLHEYARAHPELGGKTHAILREMCSWTRKHTKKVFEPYKLEGRPNGFFLTPAGVREPTKMSNWERRCYTP